MKQYLVLSILHTCFRPWSEDLNVFSSVKTTLDQKSSSLSTCCLANASRPSRCAFVSASFFAGILWCIPAPWSRLLIVSADTCNCRWSLCCTAVLNGCSWAARIIRSSSSRVVALGRGLLATKEINSSGTLIFLFVPYKLLTKEFHNLNASTVYTSLYLLFHSGPCYKALNRPIK